MIANNSFACNHMILQVRASYNLPSFVEGVEVDLTIFSGVLFRNLCAVVFIRSRISVFVWFEQNPILRLTKVEASSTESES